MSWLSDGTDCQPLKVLLQDLPLERLCWCNILWCYRCFSNRDYNMFNNCTCELKTRVRLMVFNSQNLVCHIFFVIEIDIAFPSSWWYSTCVQRIVEKVSENNCVSPSHIILSSNGWPDMVILYSLYWYVDGILLFFQANLHLPILLGILMQAYGSVVRSLGYRYSPLPYCLSVIVFVRNPCSCDGCNCRQLGLVCSVQLSQAFWHAGSAPTALWIL